MMYHMMGSTKGVAMVLISLGVGYLVCAKADKEKGFLRQLGYWIGAIIIIVSVLTSLCSLHCKAAQKMSCVPYMKCPLKMMK